MNTTKLPSEYKERVLISVIGGSPAVLTETLWALKHQATPFIPTKIKVVTTGFGEDQTVSHLLLGKDGRPAEFLKYCEDYDLDPTVFCETNIEVVSKVSEAGIAKAKDKLQDIVTEEDNQLLSDLVVSLVKAECSKSNSAVHVSLAGGRKTMGYYIGYALSLFGRNQDRLSHTLVDPDYEKCSDFYYPTTYSHPVENNREGLKFDAKNARVYLADIPFVRIRENLPPSLITGDISFNDAVDMANWKSDELRVGFKFGELALYINERRISCDKKNMINLAFLKMILDAQFEQKKPILSYIYKEEERNLARLLLENLAFFMFKNGLDDEDVSYEDDRCLLELLGDSVNLSTLKGLVTDDRCIHKTKDGVEVKGHIELFLTEENFNSRKTQSKKLLISLLGKKLGTALALKSDQREASGEKVIYMDISEEQYLR